MLLIYNSKIYYLIEKIDYNLVNIIHLVSMSKKPEFTQEDNPNVSESFLKMLNSLDPSEFLSSDDWDPAKRTKAPFKPSPEFDKLAGQFLQTADANDDFKLFVQNKASHGDETAKNVLKEIAQTEDE